MGVILILVSFLAVLFTPCSGWTQFRNKFEGPELYYVCDTVERAEVVFAAADMMHKIAVIWTTYDSNIEPYFKLYLEYMLELTKGSDVVHVILETSPRDLEFLPRVLEHIPEKSLFVMIHDSDLRLDLCLLTVAMSYLGKPPPVMFHMNHERPWLHSETIGMTANMSHCTTSDLAVLYPTYTHVFRNYYYADFLGISEYVPLLSLHPRALGRYRQRVGLRPSSERAHWCRFAGRINYDNVHGTQSPFHAERNQFLNLLLESRGKGDGQVSDRSCTALFDTQGDDGHKLSYEEYIEYMADTVFAPCPAGNSPETFRHYEAMELGLIPLMVRPPPESDFLQAWTGYPGPVFSSWEEAMFFIERIDYSTLDDLQSSIRTWYSQFKQEANAKFSRKLNHLFGLVDEAHKQERYSKLAMDKTNAPTAAAQLLEYAPTSTPSIGLRKRRSDLSSMQDRLEALERVSEDVKNSLHTIQWQLQQLLNVKT